VTTQERLWQKVRAQARALLPGVRATRADGLAALVLGLLLAGNVALTRVAAALPFAADDPSTERRLRRWVANPGVAVGEVWGRLLPVLLRRAGGRPVFVFDPTPHVDRFTVLAVGLVVHKRVMPVAWRLVPQRAPWPEPMEELLGAMLGELDAALPAGAEPTLLVDRGITSARTVDRCRALGWGFVFRVNAGPNRTDRARLGEDGEERALWGLVTEPGQRFAGPVAVFKGAGWRALQLTIRWDAGAAEPWILISDAPAGNARVAEYRKRARCEATYLDLKSRGWDVEATKLVDPARLDRLLLGLHVAFWWAHDLGLRVVRAGERHRYDRADRRDKSLVKLGWAVLKDRLAHERMPALLFALHHGEWRLSYAP
jgi:hypothetical protein